MFHITEWRKFTDMRIFRLYQNLEKQTEISKFYEVIRDWPSLSHYDLSKIDDFLKRSDLLKGPIKMHK